MDPIGTITTYFPFIEKETKNVLEGIMTEASDYYDFVQRLGELVLKNDSPIMVVYFAIHHAILALDYPLIDMIREKYGDNQILGPNLFLSSAYEGTYEDVKKAHELADAILVTEPEDWIALEMHFMKFEADMQNYPTTIYKTSTMDRIRELIDSNPDFGFYETILCDYLSIRAQHDGDPEGRLRCLNRGLEIAKKFDDRLRIAHLLILKASLFKGKAARKLLEQAYEIVDTSLGIPVNFADIIYKLGVLDAIRGDFDNAIKRCLESVSIRERAGLETGTASLFLSLMYNVIGEPESGLEWGLMAEEQFKGRPYLINRSVLFQIWSLILLKRLSEAQIILDTTRESVLKSGDESQLAWLHFVTGVLEYERGDFSLAESSIEQALRIYEKFNWAYAVQIVFLHHLAKVEIHSSDTVEALSPSLALLEEKSISEDLPGIQGQVLLLKAELAIMTSDDALLREIFSQLRSLIEKNSLHFLEPYMESLQANL
jgi:tetratricopeptide (TPR) repeat protein